MPLALPRRPRPPKPFVGACSLLLVGLLALPASLPAAASAGAQPARKLAAAVPGYAQRDDVRRYAVELAERRELPLAWVEQQLARARRIDAARKLVMPPAAGMAKNWAAYRERFVEAQRIGAGTAFWQQHEATLERAERRYGVPAEIVVGIIGVETFFGRITGRFRVLDALTTLAFDFPAGRSDRSDYFRAELEEYLVMCAREGHDPASLVGSFAGAIGLPQFMPGSINRWAVDFDGDGRIDLQRSVADAVGSVAHFLQAHGWQPGLPTHHDVEPPVDGADRALLLAPDILPSFSAAQMGERGARLDEAGRAHPGPLALVEVANGDAPPSHIAGTQNFFALTRYNRSSYYALAVIELGRAVAAARAGR